MGTYDFQFKNNAVSTLAAAITSTAQTSVSLSAGTGGDFPVLTGDGSDYFYITVVKNDGTREIMCIVARSSDTLTVGIPGSGSANSSGRGYDNSTSSTFSVDDVVELRLTAGIIDTFRDGIKGATSTHTAKTADYTLTSGDLDGNSRFTNDGAGGGINFTWPAISAGQRAKFIVVDAEYLKITAPAGEKFRYGETEGAAAGYIRSNTAGNVVECEATADNILITNIIGEWNYDE